MEDMDSIDPMTFTPFGAGPRNCIAMRFAQLEVKVAMCKLLLEFDLDVCDDTPVSNFFFLSSDRERSIIQTSIHRAFPIILRSVLELPVYQVLDIVEHYCLFVLLPIIF